MYRIVMVLAGVLLSLGALTMPVAAQERFEAQMTTLSPQEDGQYSITVAPRGEPSFQTVIDPNYLSSPDLLKQGQFYVFERTMDGGLYIVEVVRRPALVILFALFLLVTVVVAGWQGVRSLLGMGLSFVVIIGVMLPALLQGYDPVWTAILASLVLVPLNFFLSHGVNAKTFAAALGTLAALILTGIMATIFTEMTSLTGFSSEEISFLELYFPDGIEAKGLLLAGIIIGLLGVLDDVTITQAAVTMKLREANPLYTKAQLIKKSMDVGRDHIASVVNTLILVYVGATLPLLLLFMTDTIPWSQILNSEVVAEEIVRMLIGSIGLILAVPLTTVLAAMWSGALKKIAGYTPGKDDTACCDH